MEHPIDQIVELKSQAEAIRVYTVQKQLGTDSQLAATEIVRRAERGIGVAIRAGQERGEIRSLSDTRTPGRDNRVAISDSVSVPRAVDLVSRHDLMNTNGIYAITDGITDEQFDEAIAVARSEKNLSRANTVKTARVIAETNLPPAEMSTLRANRIIEEKRRRYGTNDRPEILRKTRRLDSNRIVEQTVISAYISDELLEAINYDELNPASLIRSADRTRRADAVRKSCRPCQ